jgi:hypothetical protein
MQSLRIHALKYPDTEEGVACEGTSLEKRTIKVKNKAFLFLGLADAMVKLDASLPEATKLAAKEPGRYKVGAHAWVSVKWGDDEAPVDLLKRWIDESYRLFAPQPREAKLPKAKSAKKRGNK